MVLCMMVRFLYISCFRKVCIQYVLRSSNWIPLSHKTNKKTIKTQKPARRQSLLGKHYPRARAAGWGCGGLGPSAGLRGRAAPALGESFDLLVNVLTKPYLL